MGPSCGYSHLRTDPKVQGGGGARGARGAGIKGMGEGKSGGSGVEGKLKVPPALKRRIDSIAFSVCLDKLLPETKHSGSPGGTVGDLLLVDIYSGAHQRHTIPMQRKSLSLRQNRSIYHCSRPKAKRGHITRLSTYRNHETQHLMHSARPIHLQKEDSSRQWQRQQQAVRAVNSAWEKI